MALTDIQAKSATLPVGKTQIKLTDGGGMYLLVTKPGKYWRMNYRYGGKRKTLAIGVYPEVPLAGRWDKRSSPQIYIKGARDYRDDAKFLLKQNIDPSLKKQVDRHARIAAARQAETDIITFEILARKWHSTHNSKWSDKHAKTILRRLELYIFPSVGRIPVGEIKQTVMVNTLIAIAELGHSDLPMRISQVCRQIFEYANNLGIIDAIPMGNMSKVLPVSICKPMPAIIEPKRLGELLRAIDVYKGTKVVICALKLLPLLAVRSGEFRASQWEEFDLDNALWTIPATHRKLSKAAKADSRNVHLVPLSNQAIGILRDLFQLTGNGDHVFPSIRGDSRPMSDNTINVAIHAMGFEDMVGHGWRTSFSTLMNEQNINPDAIERQLAHVDKDKVRASYPE